MIDALSPRPLSSVNPRQIRLADVTGCVYLTSSQCDKRAVRADCSTLWPSFSRGELQEFMPRHCVQTGLNVAARTPELGPRFCFPVSKRDVSRTLQSALASTNRSASG